MSYNKVIIKRSYFTLTIHIFQQTPTVNINACSCTYYVFTTNTYINSATATVLFTEKCVLHLRISGSLHHKNEE